MNSYYSNIYWHFTGSPKNLDWTKVFCPSDILKSGQPKTDDECLNILENILTSSKLIAKAREKIDSEFYSDPFCCVTDIPIQNLKDHRKYYGNVVLGFKHNGIQRMFNPVFYLSRSFLPSKAVGFEDLPDSKRIALSMRRFKRKQDYLYDPLLKYLMYGSHVDKNKLGSFLFHHFKITQFSENPNNTFYREREWRKLGDFKFTANEIAAIIVPEKCLNKAKKYTSPVAFKDCPVLTWELLDLM